MSYNLITILGPTATGKTKLAAKLSERFNGEIISADSRQVYRGMDIGTGKDFEDYIVNGHEIPFHLIDVIDPSEEFDLYKFNELFYKNFNEIKEKNKIPFLVGGTGLYISSVIQSYKLSKAEFSRDKINSLNKFPVEELRKKFLSLNPALHNTTDLLDKERLIKAIIVGESSNKKIAEIPEINSLVIGITLPSSEIKKRITERLRKRLQSGMVEEVEKLLQSGISREKLNFFGLEYKYASLYLAKELNYNDMFQKLNSAIHNFAKRQMTWFRKMEKEGVKINWINGPDFESAKNLIERNFS